MTTASNRMSNGGGGLQFLQRQLVDETAALSNMAAGFLAPGGDGVLAGLKSQLERIPEWQAGRATEIGLRPLCTRPTRDYEPGSRSGGFEVYAKVTGIWEVQPIGGGHPKAKIAFTGKASAVVELWPEACMWSEEQHPTCRLAMWRFELGAADSPGCYFHAQILGDRDAPPFPKSIPIPRLPSPFVTPMAAVEFVLGELFQDRWHRKVSEDGPLAKRWRTIQHERWSSFLSWQARALQEDRSSPWMNLKAAKPPTDLFISN